MKRLLCLSGIVLIMVACTDKERIPGGVLAKDKMEKVLWDVIQAERYSAIFLSKDSSINRKAETFKLYEQIFSLHKITKDEFVKSYKFYLSRPDISRVMFDSLATKANRSREEIYNKPATTTPPPASTPAPVPAPVPGQTFQKRDSIRNKRARSLFRQKPVPASPIKDTSRLK